MPVSTSRTAVVRLDSGERQIDLPSGFTLREALQAAGIHLRASCGGNGSCGECVVRLAESAAIPFTVAERSRLDANQLAAGLRLACQIGSGDVPSGALHVSLAAVMPRERWRTMRDHEFTPFMLPAPLRAPRARYGIAIDLGTTHIRLTLWDAVNGKRLGGRMGANPQGSYGVDVLSRLMHAADSASVAREMLDLTARAIGEGVAEMAQASGIDLHEVGEVLVVGNTAMLTLLAGRNYELLMQPGNWDRAIACEPDERFLIQAWGLGENATVEFIQPLGGFIGSDLLAGLIATGLTEQPSPQLLIDFGTNSEMALWDGQRLRATSTAGGPAFEGSGISCGMPAENGAIYRVSLTDRGELLTKVVGDVPALGVCGSGLVDAVAALLQTERLDRVGRFRQPGMTDCLLAEGEHRIALMRADIDVLQRAKAAIGAGVTWLCAQAGVRMEDLQQVVATGAFGRLLDIAHARQIGLLPPVPGQRVHLENNSALAGCEMLLLSPMRERLVERMRSLVEVRNLAEDAAFEIMFVENLYLQPMRA